MPSAAALCLVDDNAWHFGERLKNSFEYFHKNERFFLCNPNRVNNVLDFHYTWPCRDNEPTDLNKARVDLLFKIKLYYGYDVVMLFDADVVVTSYLDEFIIGDYDIAVSQNVERYPGDRYVNMGVTSVASNKFAEDWASKVLDTKYIVSYGNEQEILNLICGTLGRDSHVFKDNPYKVKIVDQSRVYYNERSRNYWGDIKIKDDKMFCNNRQLKAMHWAGGTDFGARWSCKVFSQQTREHLNKITKTTDFTDHEGHDAHWFHH